MTTEKVVPAHNGTAAGAPPVAPSNGVVSVAPDVFPDFAIDLDEAVRRIKVLQQYVREHMVEGEDYGVIPGSTKPTLFKPGAEKLNAIFGLAPMVEITNRVEDWEHGFVSYEVKITLINKRTGQVEAEGLGSCNSRERRYKNQDAAGIANTILKMSKKRALVDATLSATRASGLFTQDLEDLDGEMLAHRGGERVERSAERSERQPERPQYAPREEGAEPRAEPRSAGWESNNSLTDAQHRAILAIAGRVFGRPATGEDFAQLVNKPVEQLSKSEASALIDRLRFRLAEQQSAPQRERESRSFNRTGQSGHRQPATR